MSLRHLQRHMHDCCTRSQPLRLRMGGRGATIRVLYWRVDITRTIVFWVHRGPLIYGKYHAGCALFKHQASGIKEWPATDGLPLTLSTEHPDTYTLKPKQVTSEPLNPKPCKLNPETLKPKQVWNLKGSNFYMLPALQS